MLPPHAGWGMEPGHGRGGRANEMLSLYVSGSSGGRFSSAFFYSQVLGFEACSPPPHASNFLGRDTAEQETKLSHVTPSKPLCTCQEIRPTEGKGFAQSHTAKWWPELGHYPDGESAVGLVIKPESRSLRPGSCAEGNLARVCELSPGTPRWSQLEN